MADWPRAISPEDRVKYLIEARHTFKETVEWKRDKDDNFRASTYDEEYLSITPIENGYAAYYQMGEEEDFLVGEFATSWDARKALTDHAVVNIAVRQAWEDLAT